jgi:hypothetical protein
MGATKESGKSGIARMWRRSKDGGESIDIEREVPTLIPEAKEYESGSGRS